MSLANIRPVVVPLLLLSCALPIAAQGPGSCGFHLDVLADRTSTHAAIADMPGAPGSGGAGYPAGAPGNPYTAYVTPGTVFKLQLSVPPSTLGPRIGTGSLVTILWSLGTPNVAVPTPAGGLAPCQPGQPWIISVLPVIQGAILDGIGWINVPVPPTRPADPGHPYKLEVTLLYPPQVGGVPVMFQAAAITPQGLLAVSNGVSLIAGVNGSEQSVLGAMGGCPGGVSPFDEGEAALPTPPAFTFYGFPAGVTFMNVNGYLSFTPASCDRTGSSGDLGCAPATVNASPRIAANHFDADFALGATPPRIDDVTFEIAPPGPNWPQRHIYRWKNAVPRLSPSAPPAIDTDYASMVCELWAGASVPGGAGPSTIVVVRQDTHPVSRMDHHDMIGIGPGVAGQGFGGPPPNCWATALWSLYATPGFAGGPGHAIYQDAIYDSSILGNLAVVFTPQVQIPVLPLPYRVTTY